MNFLSKLIHKKREVKPFHDIQNIAMEEESSADDGKVLSSSSVVVTKPVPLKVDMKALALSLDSLQEDKENIINQSSRRDDRFLTSRVPSFIEPSRSLPVTARSTASVIDLSGYSLPSSRAPSPDSYEQLIEEMRRPMEPINSARTLPTSRSAVPAIQESVRPFVEEESVIDDKSEEDLEVEPYQEEDVMEDVVEEDYLEWVFSKARHNRLDEVRKAIQEGFSVNTRDQYGNTLLHVCAQNNHVKLAAVILSLDKKGTVINARNLKLLTPLDYAIRYNFDRMKLWLEERGAQRGVASHQYRPSSFR
eukprot:gene383-416_t